MYSIIVAPCKNNATAGHLERATWPTVDTDDLPCIPFFLAPTESVHHVSFTEPSLPFSFPLDRCRPSTKVLVSPPHVFRQYPCQRLGPSFTPTTRVLFISFASSFPFLLSLLPFLLPWYQPATNRYYRIHGNLNMLT